MRRIGLYLGFAPEGGGAFQYAQSILCALAALPPDAYEVVVVDTQGAWNEKLASFDSRVVRLPFKANIIDKLIPTLLRVGFPLRIWRFLAPKIHGLTRHLWRAGCDLWIFPAQEVWTYAAPVPALGVIHDLMHRYEACFPEVSALGLYHRRERHYRNLCSTALGVLVDSEVGKRQTIESYEVPPDHVHVLPFVPPTYMLKDEPPLDCEDRFDLPENFIFYPAQLWKHKNHVRLLEAFSIARRSVASLHLVLAGSSKNASHEIIDRIEKLALQNYVHLLGYVPDEYMPWLYRRARALIFPSFFGPTNIPPLEAMVAGCPMAISGIYAMPEQVGDAALFFDPVSVDDIAQAIIRLATDDDLHRQLREAGRSQARLWDQEAFNTRVQSILETVLGP